MYSINVAGVVMLLVPKIVYFLQDLTSNLQGSPAALWEYLH